jgi:hypothetical protein
MNSFLQPRKKVHFAPPSQLKTRHTYHFDWSLASSYWYEPYELSRLKETRYEEADILRKERGISSSSRDDADKYAGGLEKDIFVGDSITHALDDRDDGVISVRGIEHFVWPVLQKEMIARKKELKRYVIEYSKDKNRRTSDPKGEKLAAASIERSQWARDVASERGIKYCEMKRGGGLLKNTRAILSRRKLNVNIDSSGRLVRRASLIKGFRRMSLKCNNLKGLKWGEDDA